MDRRELSRKLFTHTNIADVCECYARGFIKPHVGRRVSIFFFFLFLSLLLLGLNLKSLGGHADLFDQHAVAHAALYLSGFGTSLGIGLLSVAIAGFAILASSFDENNLDLMIGKDYPRANVPVLVFVFSMFVYNLSALLALCAFSVLVGFIADEAGIFAKIVVAQNNVVGSFIYSFLLSFQISQLLFAFFVLKSFIWNLYQILLTVAALKVLR